MILLFFFNLRSPNVLLELIGRQTTEYLRQPCGQFRFPLQVMISQEVRYAGVTGKREHSAKWYLGTIWLIVRPRHFRTMFSFS